MNQTITPLVDPRCWDNTTAALRSAAAQLLTDGTVAAVVGYIAGRRAGSAMPAIIIPSQTPTAASVAGQRDSSVSADVAPSAS